MPSLQVCSKLIRLALRQRSSNSEKSVFLSVFSLFSPVALKGKINDSLIYDGLSLDVIIAFPHIGRKKPVKQRDERFYFVVLTAVIKEFMHLTFNHFTREFIRSKKIKRVMLNSECDFCYPFCVKEKYILYSIFSHINLQINYNNQYLLSKCDLFEVSLQ